MRTNVRCLVVLLEVSREIRVIREIPVAAGSDPSDREYRELCEFRGNIVEFAIAPESAPLVGPGQGPRGRRPGGPTGL